MPKSLPRALVLFGHRGDAARAARFLHREFLTVTVDARKRRGTVATLDIADAPDELARQVVSVCRPIAVVALTEASVVPAARLREVLGLPGMTPAAAERCTDKALMKAAIRDAGLGCADYVTYEQRLDRAAMVERLGLPLVVKAIRGSGSRGTAVCHRFDEVPAQLADGWMAEAFVDGVEMSVEALVHEGTPVFSNLTEYVERRWANLVPAVVDAEADILTLQRAAIGALGAERCMTHMEVFLTESGVVFGELAARPPGGHIMALIRLAYGFDPWQALLQVACGQPPSLAEQARGCAGVRLFHPGDGVVTTLQGVDRIEALPAFHSQRWRVATGERLGPRIGTGQEAGHVLFAGRRTEVIAGLAEAKRHVRIRTSH